MGKPMRKGDSKALTISHPKSRKAKALSKKIIKAAARHKKKVESAIKRNIFGEKLLWFRDNLQPGEEYTAVMFDQLFQKYLSRFDDELEQIAIKHSIGQRKNRQHANREDIINMTKNQEIHEYNTCGIEMVNLLSQKQLKLFRQWDGELGFLNQFKIKRFSKSYLNNYVPSISRATSVNNNDLDEERQEDMATDEEFTEENDIGESDPKMVEKTNENGDCELTESETKAESVESSEDNCTKNSMEMEVNVT